MSAYPDYVHRILSEARDIGQYYCGQADGAALCFDLLADFPDCAPARELVYELFCDEWLIYDNRVALQRVIDEWDDQPHAHRRRLARSFGYMSRLNRAREDPSSDEPEDEDLPFEDEESPLTRDEAAETKRLLSQGKMQLLEAYCLGDDEATEYAWPRFMQAIATAHDSQRIRMAVAKQYADLGFFADAVEILLEYISAGGAPSNLRAARRLLAEVGWWRDNAYRIPWLPPPGDGSRYDRLIKLIDPDAPTRQEYLDYVRAHLKEIGKTPTWEPVITSELKELFNQALPNEPAAPRKTPVDWSFLDREDGSSAEVAPWVARQIRMVAEFGQEYADNVQARHKLTRPIAPPTVPKNYDPRALRDTGFEEIDLDDEAFWDEWDDGLEQDDGNEE